MYKTILLPIDLSEPFSWTKALPTALNLCDSETGTLHVLTVVPDLGTSVIGKFFEPGFEQQALHSVGKELGDWVKEHVPDGVSVQSHVMLGRVYEEIISAANQLDADAIVMCSHTPDLTDYLLGPNAARVVRYAKQSVFVIRGK
jgi:nucleotide-binding universal stress UspA family protein